MTDPKQHLKQTVQDSGLSFKQWYNEVYMKSDHWKNLRAEKFAVSGKACQQCAKTHDIQVHHLAYRAIFDVTVIDLLVVCGSCHKRLHEGEETSPKAARMPKTIPVQKALIKQPKTKRRKEQPVYVTPQGHMMSKKQRKRARQQLLLEQIKNTPLEEADCKPVPIPRAILESMERKRAARKLELAVDREVVPAIEGSGMVLVTKEMILAIKTSHGSWTLDQHYCLGVKPDHKKGWLDTWQTHAIPASRWHEAEAITRLSAIQSTP